jgi:hypothetical protein
VSPTFTAWSTWTPELGPPSPDLLGSHATTRCLRAAAHVLAPLCVDDWTTCGLVIASASGDPDGSTPLAHLPDHLAAALRPAFTTAICAGSDTVASSLIETLCRLARVDRIVTLVIEPAPAAELAVALSTVHARSGAGWALRPIAPNDRRTTSTPRSRNDCAPALDLCAALRSRRSVVPISDRFEVALAWRDAPSNAQ